MIDNQKARIHIWGDLDCYPRPSEWSCKFQPWNGQGRWGRWQKRCKAGQAGWKSRTQLGDGHNLQIGTATQWEFSVEVERTWWINANGMGRCSWLLLWERDEVQNGQFEGSGRHYAANWHGCSHTSSYNICKAWGDSRYRPRKIANAATDLVRNKESYEARFRETKVSQMHIISVTWWGAWCVTDQEIEACWTGKLLSLRIASLGNCDNKTGFRQRNHDGSCVTTGIDSQIAIFDNISLWKAICVPISLCGSCFWISLTKLWDMISGLCMCKGHTGQLGVLDSQPRR